MAVTVVVAGAGITGLAAAWELSRARVDAIVLDGGRRPGGMIVTERPDGFVVEGGPDGFLAAEPDIQVLAREAGIGARLVDQLVKGSTQWTGKSFEPLPEGRAAELLGIQSTADAYSFRSFAGGMAEIVDALAGPPSPLARLIRPAQGVTGLAPATRGWRLSVTGGSTVEGKAVILALPAWTTARLVAAAGAPGGRHLDSVVYHPSLTVSLAYRAEQLSGPAPAGTGFVAAGEWSGAVRACSYSSLKYPGRAPAGHVLLRAFLGPVDGDPATLAHTELASILGIAGPPLWSRAFAWTRGLPRYTPDHSRQVAAVRHELQRLPPLAIAGAGFDGAGVSACVRSGREAARLILRRVG